MATKPELRRAVANSYIKASDYNYNFDQLNNYIENGIADNAITNYENDREFPKGQWVLAEVGGEFGIYESEVDGNKGNSLLDKTYWKKVNLGAGLEIGDIGIAPLGIDETKGKRRYLNGQVIVQDQYTVFSEKVKNAINLYPTLGCTEQEWQTIATMSVGGQVGKFVVDDDAGTIRLPKIIMPIQGLTDLNKLAEIVEAGLPNITGELRGDNSGLFGAFYSGGSISGSATAGNTGNTDQRMMFDASRSSSIYSNSTTVQQEQIQYPYFIQVATGAETEDNIINEIELNNPFFFGMSQYFESEPNNISWLKSARQWNAKAVHTDYYDWLLKIYNGTETVEGVSVKLSTEEYTDYDFVLNTAEETFRLPLLDGSENIVDYNNGQTIATDFIAPCNGLIIAFNKSLSGSSATAARLYVNGVNVGVASGGTTIQDATSMYALVKQGDVVTFTNMNIVSFFKSTGNGSLYFYVGETVQNANLINAGRIEEKLSDCITRNDCKAYIVETYINGTSWYRIWSDKWCEQGGYLGSGSSVVTFLKPFKDTNYSAMISGADTNYNIVYITTDRTTTSMTAVAKQANGSTFTNSNKFWEVKGYIA